MFKILIVDDNQSFRQSLKDILNFGISCVLISESSNAKDALDKVNSFEPDLIFMDINLAGENGLSLTRVIKLEHSKMIIFVITGHDIPEYNQAAFQAGASYYMSKDSLSTSEIRNIVTKISYNQQIH
jgi:DNA-binding NarL/FixJ family response regulator